MEKMQKMYSPRVFANEPQDDNLFLGIHEIRKGDVFYECERGVNIELEALGDARKTRNGWLCKVKTNNKTMIIYSSTTSMYGPSLYRLPYYLTMNENNQSVFVVE
jgi:hypothetical protein